MILNVIIFMAVLLLYLNLVFHYKKSEDNEVYEIDYQNNNHLQTVCDLRQPILFNVNFDETLSNNVSIKNFEKSPTDIYVKDTIVSNEKEDETKSFIVPFSAAIRLMKTDTASHYYTEENAEFIEEENLTKHFATLDNFLKPNFVIMTNYDIWFGSNGTTTPLRYHTNYRTFIFVHQKKISIKLASFRNSKYLECSKKNRTCYTNVWNVPKKNIEKVHFIEMDILPGNILYLPPYWWYSIKYYEESLVFSATYNTVMNLAAFSIGDITIPSMDDVTNFFRG